MMGRKRAEWWIKELTERQKEISHGNGDNYLYDMYGKLITDCQLELEQIAKAEAKQKAANEKAATAATEAAKKKSIKKYLISQAIEPK